MSLMISIALAVASDPRVKPMQDISMKRNVDKLLRVLVESKNSTETSDALVRLGELAQTDERVVPKLVSLLENDATRLYGISALGLAGRKAKSAVSQIAEILFDERQDKYARSGAANTLGLIGAPALPMLRQGLRAKDAFVRRHCALALSRFVPDGTEVIPLLLSCFEDSDSSVREAALEGFEIFGENAMPALEKALKDKKASTRIHAASAIISHRGHSPVATKTLVDGLSSKNEEERLQAANGLRNVDYRAKSAVPALAIALQDTNCKLRADAAFALANIGPNSAFALDKLVACLTDEDEYVRAYAALALGKIGKDAVSAVPALMGALKCASFETKVFVIRALGEIGPAATRALPQLKNYANNPDYEPFAKEAIEKILKRPKTSH